MQFKFSEWNNNCIIVSWFVHSIAIIHIEYCRSGKFCSCFSFSKYKILQILSVPPLWRRWIHVHTICTLHTHTHSICVRVGSSPNLHWVFHIGEGLSSILKGHLFLQVLHSWFHLMMIFGWYSHSVYTVFAYLYVHFLSLNSHIMCSLLQRICICISLFPLYPLCVCVCAV